MSFFNRLDISRIEVIKISGKESLEGRPLNKNKFSFEKIINKQAFHQTVDFNDLSSFLTDFLNQRSNITIHCPDYIYGFKQSKSGKLLSNKTPNNSKTTKKPQEKFLLPTDIPVFYRIGLVTSEGKLIERMRSKYEQITRFCELVVDAVGNKKEIKIIDCGCGKAYLSFALYHYLTKVKNIKTTIHGTDLKEEVINELKELASVYQYDGLTFSNADIKKLDLSEYDMMISLHACDKATDFAIFNAIRGGVGTILSVPCCQQEMNASLNSENLPIFSRFGLIKERVSALMTDAVRASVLTAFGYKVKTVELVDFEHSPKNLMIKAQKSSVTLKTRLSAFKEATDFLKEFNTTCELYTLSEAILSKELET